MCVEGKRNQFCWRKQGGVSEWEEYTGSYKPCNWRYLQLEIVFETRLSWEQESLDLNFHQNVNVCLKNGLLMMGKVGHRVACML